MQPIRWANLFYFLYLLFLLKAAAALSYSMAPGVHWTLHRLGDSLLKPPRSPGSCLVPAPSPPTSWGALGSLLTDCPA